MAGLLSGCEPPKSKLVVARIDTAVLLQADPEYNSLSVEYLKEQTEIRQRMLEAMKKHQNSSEATKKEVAAKFEGEQKKLNEKWAKKTQDFLDDRHSAIKSNAEEISKAKEIDIVLIDSKFYPTVEWGAVDITQDVQLKMVERESK